MPSCSHCRHFRPRTTAEYGDCVMAERIQNGCGVAAVLAVMMFPHEGQDCRAFEPGKPPKPEPVEKEPRQRRRRGRPVRDGLTAPGVPVEVEDEDGD